MNFEYKKDLLEKIKAQKLEFNDQIALLQRDIKTVKLRIQQIKYERTKLNRAQENLEGKVWKKKPKEEVEEIHELKKQKKNQLEAKTT